MPLNAGDIERAERTLQRSIIKRDRQKGSKRKAIFYLYALVRQVTHDSNITPVVLARKIDIESLLTDFRSD